MTASSTPLEHTEEGRAFLQRRVSWFGLLGAGLGGIFLVYRVIESLVGSHVEAITHPSMGFHALGAASLLVIWVACRKTPRTVGQLRAIEGVGLFGSSVGYSAMGGYLPLLARPDMIVLLALTYGLVARAVYVPSTASRTIALSSAVAIPPLVMTYLVTAHADLTAWRAVYPSLQLDNTTVALSGSIGAAVWWSLTVAVCAATSRVIYGLRREVRGARRLGQYTLDQKLGEGGMGTVYRAHHAMLRRPTAVKLLRPDKVGETSITRFEREVQITASLTHPNTVTIYDFGRTPDGTFYYAMEMLDGPTLEEVVALDGPQPPARVAHILIQVAGALAEAHGVGLIHRDIKPANIILCAQGGEHDVAKVLDFGLVKQLDTMGAAIGVTHDQALLGTPLYLSPEAIKSPESLDSRADLYALGAVGYFLLTGKPVFEGSNVVEICGHHLHTTPEPPSQRVATEIPGALEQVILECLAKEPADRPQTAADLRLRLAGCGCAGEWNPADARTRWLATWDRCCTERRHPDSTAPRSLTIDVARRVTDPAELRELSGRPT